MTKKEFTSNVKYILDDNNFATHLIIDIKNPIMKEIFDEFILDYSNSKHEMFEFIENLTIPETIKYLQDEQLH